MDVYSSEKILNIYFKKYHSNNLQIISGTVLGKRKENNDIMKVDNVYNSDIFLLADGHGGNYISKLVCNKMLYYFYKKFKFNKLDKCKVLYNTIDEEIYNAYYCKNFHREGSTLTCVIVNETDITAINLGDSNYLIRNSDDEVSGTIHRLTNNLEINRIITNKYRVIKIGKRFRVDGKLEVSRSFGDFYYKLIKNKYNGYSSAVSCVPCHKIMKNTFKYIVLASDGLWDYIEKVEVMKLLDNGIDIVSMEKLVEKLIKLAISNGSGDNISIILIKKCG